MSGTQTDPDLVRDNLNAAVVGDNASTPFFGDSSDLHPQQSTINTTRITTFTDINSVTDATHNAHTQSSVTLDVGGQIFKTLFSTLTSESGYFRALFSEEWDSASNKERLYFIDADPNTFEHLLRFMRRPGLFPLFWSRASGFDYDLYNRVGHEARFFQVDELSDWIDSQKFINSIAIKVDISSKQSIHQMCSETIMGDAEISHHFLLKSRCVYLCPRGITVHRGHPDMCGAACHRARAGTKVDYEEEKYAEVVSITKSYQLSDTQ
jgi:hypothetical protein